MLRGKQLSCSAGSPIGQQSQPFVRSLIGRSKAGGNRLGGSTTRLIVDGVRDHVRKHPTALAPCARSAFGFLLTPRNIRLNKRPEVNLSNPRIPSSDQPCQRGFAVVAIMRER